MEYRTINILTACSLGLLAGLPLTEGTTLAQTSSIVWKEIGDPGNQPWEDDRYPNHKFIGRGQVDHRYRMTETELTTSQWIGFVRAYGPHAENPFDLGLLGSYITGSSQNGELHYEIMDGLENHATEVSWRMAARFANWMHNGQASEAWAFENGAYDTSTFTSNDNPPPFYNDQDARNPDARYWIPSLDEWMKAVYYDPNKNGTGQGGWWEQPNGSDTVLIADYPENGGETNAGLAAHTGHWDPRFTVGMYPEVLTPWGLLDASGGVREWTEEWTDNHRGRYVKGSSKDDWFDYDRLDWVASNDYRLPDGYMNLGIRVASTVPAPSSGLTVVVVFAASCTPRRRRP
ncbi:hypothetical protein MNBD_PLANCTO03-121 [hydrothermal vent metagenome]|uniref:Sulfatase-modifying factor enzyme-like domain-containing protein n=1 Tax=hydrothermal vent metagenome TaxID=652676 RepID=A0A3B1DHC7_9ZZZZ